MAANEIFENIECDINFAFLENGIEVESLRDIFIPSNINFTNNLGNNALFYCRKLEVAKYLFNTGININHVNKRHETALHVLCHYQNCSDVLHFLLLNGANLDLQDALGNSALHSACDMRQYEYVQIFLYHGANTTIKNNLGETPLMLAAVEGNSILINELWPYLDNYEIDNVSKSGYTLLMYLLQSNEPKFALELLKLNPNVNIIAKDHRNALYWSIFMEDSKCFNLILSKIADPKYLEGIFGSLFRFCCFQSESEFADIVFKLLESPYAFDLVLNYDKNNDNQACLNLYDNTAIRMLLYRYQTLGKDNFIKILYSFLSYGAKVEEVDFWTILQSHCYFKCDLLDIVIDMYPYHLTFTTILVHLDTNFLPELIPMLKFTDNNVKEVLHSIFMDHKHVREMFPQIFTLLKYTSGSVAIHEMYNFYLSSCKSRAIKFSPHEKELISKIKKTLVTYTVPSLLELSREAVRLNLIYVCNVRSEAIITSSLRGRCGKMAFKLGGERGGIAYFHFAIREFPIPQYLKDVLMYQAPIYNCDNI